MSSLRAVRSAFAAATARTVLVAALAGVPLAASIPMSALAQSKPAPAAKPTGSQQSAVGGIAAVVNEDIISTADVNARIRMALMNAGVRESAETRQRLTPQVLNHLIEERLQMQEAKRLGVSVGAAEINESINNIGKQNNMTRPQLEKMLRDNGVTVTALSDQLKALLVWQQVMQRKVRSDVVIGDEEVDAVMERIKANIGKPEYLLAEIFIAVDNPATEPDMRRLADRLVDELKRGANFPALARQFSQSAGAATGGDLGWVRTGELAGELDQALTGRRGGELIGPVRSSGGYHLLLVRAQRPFGSSVEPEPVRVAPPPPPPPPARPDIAKATVRMMQIILPAEGDEALKRVKAEAEKLRKSTKGCADFSAKAKATGIPEAGDMGTLRVKDMPEGLQGFAVNVPIGQPSPVLMSGGGAIILMVCSRNVPMIQPPAPKQVQAPPPPPRPQIKAEDLKMPERAEIERDLTNQRADLLSRRYLRDLRRNAFIDVRL